jgi:hypothetical protein
LSRAELRQFAQDRIEDARVLLQNGRWQGAYYLSGYAVECGLKSCVLAHVEKTGIIFKDKDYLKDLGKCWTHNLGELVVLAGLADEQDLTTKGDVDFAANWKVVANWSESSRYEQKTQNDAQQIYDAITQITHGVLPWISQYW